MKAALKVDRFGSGKEAAKGSSPQVQENQGGTRMEAAITAQEIKVRRVTGWQPSWTEQAAGEPGTYSIQLILDQGAEEYVLRPTEDDADNLFDWLSASSEVYFDMDRKVVIFGPRALS
jgi:hypothetical protein